MGKWGTSGPYLLGPLRCILPSDLSTSVATTEAEAHRASFVLAILDLSVINGIRPSAASVVNRITLPLHTIISSCS